MPVHIAKRGTKYCAVDDKGKVGFCHADRERVKAHVAAKNIGMMRGKGDRRAPPKRKRG